MIEKFIFTVPPPLQISDMTLNTSEWLFWKVFEDQRISTAQRDVVVCKHCQYKASEISINYGHHIPGMQF